MALGILSFRVRSPNRDYERDIERFNRVQKAIEESIESASRELAGLEKRVAVALSSSSSLIDNSGDFERRDPKDEEQITLFERTALAGRQRVEELRQQQTRYEMLLQQLDDLKPKEPSRV